MTFLQSRKTQQICLQARQAWRSSLIRWYALAALQLCQSFQSAAARPASEASLHLQATCVLRVAKRPSCRNGKLVLAWSQAADRWPDCRASLAEDARWKCCWARTIFEAIWP